MKRQPLSGLRLVCVSIMVAALAGCERAPSTETASSEGAEPAKSDKKDAVTWLTNFEAVKKQAAEEMRPILADFTGSDWCPWCMKLDNEVFSKEAFKDYAKSHLVLFKVDFPQQTDQSDDLKRQNESLAREYGIQGFPTVLLLDAQGKVLARTGYRPGGAEAYVAHLKQLIGEGDKPNGPE